MEYHYRQRDLVSEVIVEAVEIAVRYLSAFSTSSEPWLFEIFSFLPDHLQDRELPDSFESSPVGCRILVLILSCHCYRSFDRSLCGLEIELLVSHK
jgi:hypothetical protein